MAGIIFDTYSAVKRLVQKGIREDQATEFVSIFTEIKHNGLNNLATKEQVAIVEKEVEGIMKYVATKADLEGVRSELKTEIEKVRTEVGNVRAELKTEIETVRTDVEKVRTEMHQGQKSILLWMAGAVIAICGFNAWFLKYFLNL
jgi:hypothetical protein